MVFITAFGIGDGFVSKSQVMLFVQVRQVPEAFLQWSQSNLKVPSVASKNLRFGPTMI